MHTTDTNAFDWLEKAKEQCMTFPHYPHWGAFEPGAGQLQVAPSKTSLDTSILKSAYKIYCYWVNELCPVTYAPDEFY